MLAVRLMGGLGNQLFQYAFGRQLSYRLAQPLYLDLRWYAEQGPGDPPRTYDLGHYPVRATIAPPGSLPPVPRTRTGELLRLLGQWRPGRMRIYRRIPPGWNPVAAVPRANTLYIGYWHSEKYFTDVSAELRQELTPMEPLDTRNAAIAAAIRGCPAVSLHVRRGDYVINQRTKEVHGLMGMDYYRAAIALIRARVGAPRFFVFSDEIEWCRQHLPLDQDTVFVSGNVDGEAYKDLHLMSLCRHHIVANSSFSWWGAWLNPNRDKLVIAPRRWFAADGVDETELVPASWLRI